MKKKLSIFLAALLITLNAKSVMCQVNSQTLVILGDSLSAAYGIPVAQGWVSILSNNLKQSHPAITVINLSRSGDTTSDGLEKIQRYLKNHTPNWLIIELGGNDGLRGLPLTLVKKNLEKIILAAQAKNCQVMLIGMTLPPNYGEGYIKAFEHVFSALAEQYALPFIPFLLSNIIDKPNMIQADGIHPTEIAQPLIYETVLNKIKVTGFLSLPH